MASREQQSWRAPLCWFVVGVVFASVVAYWVIYANIGAHGQPTVVNVDSSDAAVKALQAQVDQLQHEADRLTGLVGGVFGVIVTMAAVLVAFNLIASQWAYERDRRAMREELESDIEAKIASRSATSTASLSDEQRSFESQVTQSVATATESMESRFKALESGLYNIAWATGYYTATAMTEPADLVRSVGILIESLKPAFSQGDIHSARLSIDAMKGRLQNPALILGRGHYKLMAAEVDGLPDTPPDFVDDVEEVRGLLIDALQRAKPANATARP